MGRYSGEAEIAYAKVAENILADLPCKHADNNIIYWFLREVQNSRGESNDSADTLTNSLRTAVRGVEAAPYRIFDLDSAMTVKGIGPAIAKILAGTLFSAYPPKPPTDEDLAAVAAAKSVARKLKQAGTASKRKVVPDASGSDNEAWKHPAYLANINVENLDPSSIAAEVRPPVPSAAPQKAARVVRPYVPAVGSANYAILIVMFQAAKGPECQVELTKAEIMDRAEASGLSDKPMHAEAPPTTAAARRGAGAVSFYNGWSGFNSLLVSKHGLATARSNPKLCSLTLRGLELAEKLHRNAVQRGVIPALPGIPTDGPFLFETRPAAIAHAPISAAHPHSPRQGPKGPVSERKSTASCVGATDGDGTVMATLLSQTSLAEANVVEDGLVFKPAVSMEIRIGNASRSEDLRSVDLAPTYEERTMSKCADIDISDAFDVPLVERLRVKFDQSAQQSSHTPDPGPNAAYSRLRVAARTIVSGTSLEHPIRGHIRGGAGATSRAGSLVSSAIPTPTVSGQDELLRVPSSPAISNGLHEGQNAYDKAPQLPERHTIIPRDACLSHFDVDADEPPFMDDKRSRIESTRLPPIPAHSEFAEQYEIVLLLDQREQFSRQGNSNRVESLEAHLAHLRALGLKAEGRTLPVGDALWIARSRGMTSSGVPEEYVLDWVLERKSLQDLLQSIRSAGRYELQKYALQRCGLRHLMYLIEGDTDLLPNAAEQKAVRTAAADTEIIHGFQVLRTKNHHDTFRLLASLTRALVVQMGKHPSPEMADVERCVMFSEFAATCSMSNRAAETLHDVWGLMLATVRGMGPESVQSVLHTYPTPAALGAAYAAHHANEKLDAADALLATLHTPGTSRAVGREASFHVHRLLFPPRKMDMPQSEGARGHAANT